MKLILVSGDDYAALNFQNEWKGAKVSDIIDNPSKYEYAMADNSDEDEEYDDEEGGYELSVHEVGDVSPEFLKFFRGYIQDYDDSKHVNFWMEYETIED